MDTMQHGPADNTETIETRSVAGTLKFGRELAARLGRGDCMALAGQLGAGKTVLVRGVAEGMGVADTRVVCSPTYVLVHEYQAEPRIYHLDLYRMAQPDAELADLGLEEMLADGVVLIEWADRASAALPRPRWSVDIEITGDRLRRFTLRHVE